MLQAFLAECDLPFAVIATKADKLNKTNRAAAMEALTNHPDIPSGTPIIPFSAQTGEGKAELWNTVLKHL